MPHKPHDERFEIDDEDKKRALRTIGVLIDGEVPVGMGFAVLLFDFGPGGALYYISNAERADMITAMKEFIAKWER
jgi:hypothetical protein